MVCGVWRFASVVLVLGSEHRGVACGGEKESIAAHGVVFGCGELYPGFVVQ
jgi:hypothetical protein